MKQRQYMQKYKHERFLQELNQIKGIQQKELCNMFILSTARGQGAHHRNYGIFVIQIILDLVKIILDS